MLYVFLADGFEEIEAIAVIDVLRRANLNVKTVSVGTDSNTVVGAHGIPVTADLKESTAEFENITGVILPGGMPGTLNLEKSECVKKAVKYAFDQSVLLAAICAAPSVLGKMELLIGRKVICYPGFENYLIKADVQKDSYVVQDDNIITGRGPGVAVEFGLRIVEVLCGADTADHIREDMQCRQM